MIREMGKIVFSLTSKHRIINSRVRHALLSNNNTYQNTHWFLKSHDKRPFFPYRILHFLWSARDFFCIHNNLMLRLYKAAASSALHLRLASSLAVIVIIIIIIIIMLSKTICIHSVRKQHRAYSVTCELSET